MKSIAEITFDYGKPTCYGVMTSPSRDRASKRLSAASRVCKKYRIAERKRRLQMREYRNLKNVLPAFEGQTSATKIDVVEEAIRYIDHLHSEIAARLSSKLDSRARKQYEGMETNQQATLLHSLPALLITPPTPVIPIPTGRDSRQPLSEIRIRL